LNSNANTALGSNPAVLLVNVPGVNVDIKTPLLSDPELLTKIANYAQNNGGSEGETPTLADLNQLAITGVGGTGQPTLAMVNSVLTDTDIGRSQTDTAAKVQAIVNAYQRILSEANGATADATPNADPTAQDYAAIGVNGVDTAQEEGLLGDVIDRKTSVDIDTVGEIQALANAVQNVMDGDASVEDLTLLGVTGVTPDNLKVVRDALAAKPDAELDTLSELGTAVSDAVNQFNTALAKIANYADNNTNASPTVEDYKNAGITGVTADNLAAVNTKVDGVIKTAADQIDEIQDLADLGARAHSDALEKIANYADNNTNAAPTGDDYKDAGVTRIGGEGQPTEAMVNSALADADITGALANDRSKVQTIVDAYAAIVQSADGVAGNDEVNPTQAQYTAIGVNGVNTAEEAGLLGDVLDAKASADIGTVGQIQALADAVQNVMDGDASVAELALMGITGVTAENLKVVRDALSAATDATQLNSLKGAQGVVTEAVEAYDLAIAKIADYADDNTKPVPTADDYKDAGVTGIGGEGQPTVDMLNSGLADADITGTQADTASKVQTIVDAYVAIFQRSASQEHYATIGVEVLSQGGASLLSEVLGAKSPEDINTVDKIQALANTVDNLLGSYFGNFIITPNQLQSLGITGVTAENVVAVQAALSADTPIFLSDVRDVVTGAVNAYNAAAAKMNAYADDNGADLNANPEPELADYTALGVTGIGGTDQPTVAMVNSALADMDITGTQADTASKVQTIVDAYAAILQRYASQEHYAAIGVAVLSAEGASLLSEVLGA
jgi:hypothetical protein